MHYLVKLYLLTALFAFSTISQASQDEPTFSIGAFNEPQGDRAGAEISVSAKGDMFGGRLSGTLYNGGNNVKTAEITSYFSADGHFYPEGNTTTTEFESNELYLGFSGFAFVHLDQLINPYLGLGFFIGKTQHCTSHEEEFENCTDDPVLAVYPEFGIELNIESIQITPYIRRYYDTSDSHKSGNVYGINFGIRF
ncbi:MULTISPECIES: hypothetical protein [Colwellia]|uniref:Outer membrane protein beta-barrel domain-containing protein n=1 Tax=Colwellia marinimaniae TaxID=1513592 RepID=A0ABQ0MSR8_9GAMM|nr:MULTISPECIES: hypothetical protein [Colwellia]GAW95395.1 hypothetical protein MTCD1_00997 [Colwellia marinimaniae]